MAVKFAHAFGAHVVVFTTSPNKKEDALRLGADETVVSRNADEMKKHAGSFDFILDTVSANHDINAYINLLGVDGNITLVGRPREPLAVPAFSLIVRPAQSLRLAIGGIAETQEMLDFCGKHNITADVEVIPIQKVNEAYETIAQVGCEVPFLHRHGFSQVGVTMCKFISRNILVGRDRRARRSRGRLGEPCLTIGGGF